MSFEQQIQVRFAHCDPAGFVFYPRYFEMINGCIEDWFAGELGVTFRDLQQQEGIVFPTAHFTVDFRRPSELADVLTFRLDVASVGRTSVHIDIDVRCGTEQRMTLRQVLVCLHQATRTPVPIPPRMRDRLPVPHRAAAVAR